jgi:exopolysaccharide biosynthesis polyprenyl glycosylphosphotransferase
MRRRFLFSIAAADLTALAVAVVLGSFIVFDRALPWTSPRLPAGESIWPLLGLVTAGAVIGSYASARAWAGAAPRPTYGRALTIVLVTLAFTSLGLVLSRTYFSRPFLAVTMAIWLGGALAHRFVRRRSPWTERLVLITTEKGLVEHLRHAPHAEVVEVLDPALQGYVAQVEDGVTLGVDLREVLSDRMAQFVSSSVLSGVSVRALSTVYEEHTGRLPIVHLAEGWELRNPVVRSAGYVPIKRMIDTVLVVVTAPILIVLTAMIALAVGATSKGPVIFRQERIGLNGRPFTLYKFRTMVDGAEESGPSFAVPGDLRLTGVGRVLRRFRIDEIPQLWNTLRGDVSLVGPRPEQAVFVERFDQEIPFYSHRHLVRPGITGWAQVYYGYADDKADTVEKLSFDLYYVKHMSPWLDLHILGKSIWTVLTGFGAQ